MEFVYLIAIVIVVLRTLAVRRRRGQPLVQRRVPCLTEADSGDDRYVVAGTYSNGLVRVAGSDTTMAVSDQEIVICGDGVGTSVRLSLNRDEIARVMVRPALVGVEFWFERRDGTGESFWVRDREPTKAELRHRGWG